MLGLLYHEIGKTEDAKKYLLNACNKEPVNINAFYNYSLLLQKEGALKESIEFLNKAIARFPTNERLLYAKLVALLNSQQYSQAYITGSKLIEIAPENQEYRQIMLELSNNQ